MLLVTTIALTSCHSTGDADAENKMTKADEQRLVDLARSFILNNKKIITQEERYFIKTKQPKVTATYHGYKIGETVILWDTGEDKRKIAARLDGAMTGENYKWGLIVYVTPKAIISPSAKYRMNRIKQRKVNNGSDLLQKQVIAPSKAK